uniref:Uncharacterized protein n=1 Tax=Siphoviridae sp. ct1SN28 TaxID=2825308 RepID=A0A8S5TRM8_9CAUD|nr:MAG TPA: hypothetical protein [Siphoviridae sp. ct1SN28]
MKRSTVTKVVGTILGQKHLEDQEAVKRQANEAAIILKTVLIYEDKGIDEAMKYYNGTHSEIEYKEFIGEEE